MAFLGGGGSSVFSSTVHYSSNGVLSRLFPTQGSECFPSLVTMGLVLPVATTKERGCRPLSSESYVNSAVRNQESRLISTFLRC